jgi:hypothetical protein
MDTPVGRFDFIFDHKLFYRCLDLLMVLGGARDLTVGRRVHRVHKVYLYPLPVLIVGSLAKTSRYTCGGSILSGGARSPPQFRDSVRTLWLL